MLALKDATLEFHQIGHLQPVNRWHLKYFYLKSFFLIGKVFFFSPEHCLYWSGSKANQYKASLLGYSWVMT